MEEIKVGYFIRTNKGIIGKLKRIELDEIDKNLKWYVFDKKRPDMNIVDEIYINKPYIKKYSKNIIDLIEVRRLCEFRKSIRYKRRIYKNDRKNTQQKLVAK